MKLKVSVLIIVVALLAFSYASAALTSISLDRDVSAGTVLSDTDSNVAVKFTAGTGYASVLDETAGGEISLDLSSILTSPATGFNTEASFTIGGTDKPAE